VSALTPHYHLGGVELPGLGLWLDPQRARAGHVFVSHAHSDHIAAHQEVLLTEPTAWLMRHRLGGKRREKILAYGQSLDLVHDQTPFQLTLLPAGHILGSAMALVEARGESLLYTGDFKLRPGLAAEICEPRGADYLIMETTFGLPRYVLPAESGVWQELIQFCRTTLAEGATPVLLAYSLGKSQELLAGLQAAGLPIALHKETAKLTRIYEHFGQQFPAYRIFDGRNAVDAVLIAPPQARRSVLFQQLDRVRTAVVTGWAIDSGCRFRSGTDAAFPLSDHADFPGLIELVKRVRPKKVFTLHGFAAPFARTLRELGFDAQALSEPEQLDLALGVPSAATAGFINP
jgi:Cft2 family RNA processing exonuclease